MDEDTLVVGDNSRQFFVFGRPGKKVSHNGTLILATAGFQGVSECPLFCDLDLFSNSFRSS